MKRPQERPGRRGGKGALLILALLLAGSAALRFGNGVGEALAKTASTDHETIAEPLNCPLPPLALTLALKAREERLKEQEAAIAERFAALALADKATEDRLAKLKLLEAEVSETLARADGASEADLTRLTEMYQAMKPKDAAALFEAMAPEFAAGFLGRMQPAAAGAVLAGMSPQAAYTLSVLLAGRNALVPKN